MTEGKLSELEKLENLITQGPANARNLALNVAKGKYLFFCDSDDKIEEKYLETLYNIAKDTGADLVKSRVKCLDKDGIEKLLPDIQPPNEFKKEDITTKDEVRKWCGCWWASLYRTEIIRKYNFIFPSKSSIGEDWAFLFLFMFCARMYIFTNKTVYYHCWRSGSICTTAHDKNFIIKSRKISFSYVKKFLKNNSQDKRLTKIFLQAEEQEECRCGMSRKQFLRNIFSIRNEYSNRVKHKVLSFLGAKIKFRVSSKI